MIKGGDVYKVVVAMVPLYVALVLGYFSVRWWKMFKSDHCDAINRFNCYFVIPFFTFRFIAAIDPYHMNFRFLAGDVVAKALVGLSLFLWVKFGRKGSFAWCITIFNLSCFNNTLVVGVPILEAMYGALGSDLVVQSSVIQALLWSPLLLFLMEFRRAISLSTNDSCNNCNDDSEQPQKTNNGSIEIVVAEAGGNNNPTANTAQDENNRPQEDQRKTNDPTKLERTTSSSSQISLGSTMKTVATKLAHNPNCYACSLGLIWALVAKRWDLQMPSMVDGSIAIMGKAGSGLAMFSTGLFMALQEKVISCGVKLTMYGMALRFGIGPLTTVIGSVALGLRSNILRIAIIQAALPQAVISFIFAKEYNLHTDVISTSVIFGTIVSLPLLIVYYIVLSVIH